MQKNSEFLNQLMGMALVTQLLRIPGKEDEVDAILTMEVDILITNKTDCFSPLFIFYLKFFIHVTMYLVSGQMHSDMFKRKLGFSSGAKNLLFTFSSSLNLS